MAHEDGKYEGWDYLKVDPIQKEHVTIDDVIAALRELTNDIEEMAKDGIKIELQDSIDGQLIYFYSTTDPKIAEKYGFEAVKDMKRSTYRP